MTRILRSTLRAVLLLALVGAPTVAGAAAPADVVVIGIDGMDPGLLETYMERGLMPNFQRLVREGDYRPLGTAAPPQSPVAWSNFITGMDPGGHGIFDFIHRDAATYQPVFSAALVSEADRTLRLGRLVIPLSKGQTRLLRKGRAFWQILDEHDVPCTIFRIPANFPPAPTRSTSLSGMGTPDLLGTYGTFSLYTDDDLFFQRDISGGVVHPVQIEDGRAIAEIVGPPNTLLADRPALRTPLVIDVDTTSDAVRLTVNGRHVVLAAGEWSPWVPVRFSLLGGLKHLHGIVRFHLRSTRPFLHLYASPINLDPAHPALPISTPDDYAPRLAGRIGPFYTQGMPEDTKALEYDVLDDGEFVTQTDTVLAERWRMLDAVLDDYRGGFLFFYVSTIDQSCHALWRNDDPTHPAHTDDLGFADRFEHLYAEMDSLLGVVRERIPRDATLIVMSDHGFAPYRYRVNLNTWLWQQGYLNVLDESTMGEHPLFENVFWRRTRAYAEGLNGLYINRIGREGRGVVPERDADALLDEIARKLLDWVDPRTGEHVVTAVLRTSEIYHGPEAHNAPDAIVGFNRGYRSSDESALGTISREAITPNLGKWTGDHCMDPALVPGVLLCNRPIRVDDPDLRDLPVTILKLYGVDVPETMTGRMILEAPDAKGDGDVR